MSKLFMVLILPGLLLVGCQHHPEYETNLEKVVITFNALKQQGSLPWISANDHGNLSVQFIDKKARSAEWFRDFSTVALDCDELYLLSVDANGKHYSCFFCKNADTNRLVAVFEQFNGRWQKIDR
jgi:hypothetical protein